jgi:hypothetical protein
VALVTAQREQREERDHSSHSRINGHCTDDSDGTSPDGRCIAVEGLDGATRGDADIEHVGIYGKIAVVGPRAGRDAGVSAIVVGQQGELDPVKRGDAVRRVELVRDAEGVADE